MMKKLTTEQIKQASEIAVKRMEAQIKTLNGVELGNWVRFCNSITFTPSLSRRDSGQYIKKIKGKK